MKNTDKTLDMPPRYHSYCCSCVPKAGPSSFSSSSSVVVVVVGFFLGGGGVTVQ